MASDSSPGRSSRSCARTSSNFQLVVSDNGSTDATRRDRAAVRRRDARVTFVRHESNRGASWNFGFVVAATSGPLFKWASHDDEVRPDVPRAAASPRSTMRPTPCSPSPSGSRSTPTATSCGRSADRPRRFLAADAGPGERFADFLARATACTEAYGVIRRCALDRTRLMMPFPASDRVLLAELALLGRFVEVPEVLFLHREHEDRATRRHPTAAEIAAWYDPRRRSVLPTWRLGWEYVRGDRTGIVAPAGTKARLPGVGRLGVPSPRPAGRQRARRRAEEPQAHRQHRSRSSVKVERRR